MTDITNHIKPGCFGEPHNYQDLLHMLLLHDIPVHQAGAQAHFGIRTDGNSASLSNIYGLNSTC